VVHESIDVTATVETVDAKTREILIRLEDGSHETMVAGPEVRNFSQIKPGDHVHAQYQSALMTSIGKPGQAGMSDLDVEGGQRAPLGGKPRAGYGAEIHRTVTITGVDLDKNTVSFVNTDGASHTVEVKAPQMKAFLRTLKVGDTVDVVYTEVATIEVTQAK
jgi:hypothetical protein